MDRTLEPNALFQIPCHHLLALWPWGDCYLMSVGLSILTRKLGLIIETNLHSFHYIYIYIYIYIHTEKERHKKRHRERHKKRHTERDRDSLRILDRHTLSINSI